MVCLCPSVFSSILKKRKTLRECLYEHLTSTLLQCETQRSFYSNFFSLCRKGRINIPMLYFHRYLRLTPLLVVSILFTMSLLRFFGSGPIWANTIDFLGKQCERHWWSTLLYVQNYVNPTDICVSIFNCWRHCNTDVDIKTNSINCPNLIQSSSVIHGTYLPTHNSSLYHRWLFICCIDSKRKH